MLEHELDNVHDEDEKDPHFKGEHVFQDENAAKEALKPLFLNRAPNPNSMKARMSILASALAHYQSGNYLAYPCNNNRFSGMQRYNGPGYNLSLPDEVKKLSQESKGLLQHIHQEPNAHKGADPKQSSFRGTPKLFRMLGHLETKWVLHEPIRKRAMYIKGTEIMHFRKEKFLKYESRLVKYPDNWYADQVRAEIVAINEFLSHQILRWPGFENKTIGHRHSFDSDAVLTTPLFITRSFARNDFGLYGRCHGFWQNKSKKLRPTILLNGEETAEPDYSQCHCNIAYLEKGLTPPDDAYNIDGYHRNFVKPALPIIFNAGDEESAINALARKFHVENEDAATLISKVKIAHSAISDYFHDDKGLRLMKIESDIAVRAMLRMVRKGIPFLPIHDSFRCPVSQGGRVKEIMVESFRDIYPGYNTHVKG